MLIIRFIKDHDRIPIGPNYNEYINRSDLRSERRNLNTTTDDYKTANATRTSIAREMESFITKGKEIKKEKKKKWLGNNLCTHIQRYSLQVDLLCPRPLHLLHWS